MKSAFGDLRRNFNNRCGKDFLNCIKGVIHVGANEGQERDLYAFHQLKVLWVEPIPETFDKLVDNIRPHTNQQAYRAILSDKDGEEVIFNIANNGGASSSMLDLARHRDLWPKVEYTSQIHLSTLTLDTLLSENNLSSNDYQALIIDTQGTELLVLYGGKRILRKLKYVKVEVADFESYANCCTEKELTAFMSKNGFGVLSRECFASKPGVGNYFDIVYKRIPFYEKFLSRLK